MSPAVAAWRSNRALPVEPKPVPELPVWEFVVVPRDGWLWLVAVTLEPEQYRALVVINQLEPSLDDSDVLALEEQAIDLVRQARRARGLES